MGGGDVLLMLIDEGIWMIGVKVGIIHGWW